jgi:hypothetical protein
MADWTTPCRQARYSKPALTLFITLILAGCSALSGRAPAPTPADFAGIVANFGRRGITVQHVISGDAGCADQPLARTAISFEAKGVDQTTAVVVHLYSFADKEAFDRLRSSIDACAHSYVRDPQTFESIDAVPFVVAGQGPWAPGFEEGMRAALQEAAEQGG